MTAVVVTAVGVLVELGGEGRKQGVAGRFDDFAGGVEGAGDGFHGFCGGEEGHGVLEIC